MKYITILLLCLLVSVPAALAQEITEDAVNQIAKRMYCPVCENIPLDACGTAACEDWREEIRLMLEAGMTEEEIRVDFVERFGDRVVGTPQNPVLRGLSLFTPWVLAGVVALVAMTTFARWGRRNQQVANVASQPDTTNDTQKDYRALLEQDLRGDVS